MQGELPKFPEQYHVLPHPPQILQDIHAWNDAHGWEMASPPQKLLEDSLTLPARTELCSWLGSQAAWMTSDGASPVDNITMYDRWWVIGQILRVYMPLCSDEGPPAPEGEKSILRQQLSHMIGGALHWCGFLLCLVEQEVAISQGKQAVPPNSPAAHRLGSYEERTAYLAGLWDHQTYQDLIQCTESVRRGQVLDLLHLNLLWLT